MSEQEEKITPKMLMEEMKAIRKMVEDSKTGSQTKTEQEKEPQKEHKNLSEALDCPNCGPQTWKDVKEALPKVMKRLEDERKNMQYVCKGCGLGVEPREEEICPRCRGKEAKARS